MHWYNELIQMSLIDAEKEIEAILRGVIGGLQACSLAKQFYAICPQLFKQLLQGSTHCEDIEN